MNAALEPGRDDCRKRCDYATYEPLRRPTSFYGSNTSPTSTSVSGSAGATRPCIPAMPKPRSGADFLTAVRAQKAHHGSTPQLTRIPKGQDERFPTERPCQLTTRRSMPKVGKNIKEGRHVGLDLYDLLIEAHDMSGEIARDVRFAGGEGRRPCRSVLSSQTYANWLPSEALEQNPRPSA